MTVRNEATNIARLLDSVLTQTLRSDEVVIADGGSTDGTQEIVVSYMDRLPLRLLTLPGANISEGRNAAIRNARHDIIAVTDAGVRLEPGWLEALVGPLLDEMAGVDVVAGFFLPDPHTTFEAAMGATVLPALEDIPPNDFLPSSRSVAFRKAAWEAAGGYPEWLDYCEDLVFDMRLKDMGYRFVFAPNARVHFRPRSSLRAFFLQYYRYARGDGKADLWRGRHAIRYAAYLSAPIIVVWAWQHSHNAVGQGTFMLMGLAAIAYCCRPYAHLAPLLGRLPLASRLYALAMVPFIRLTGDVAKMLGYPVGVWWRIRRRKAKGSADGPEPDN
jgi:glycosyltransferase involved in cell wall biosynthesis